MHKVVSAIRNALLHRYHSFLRNERYPNAWIYFTAFCYFHYVTDSNSNAFSIILFLVGVCSLLVTNFNFLFILFPLAGGKLSLASIPMVLVCALASNDKWKAYLFVFAIGDSLIGSTGGMVQAGYLALSSGCFCIQIHRNLPWPTVDGNIQFFTGWFIVLCISILRHLPAPIAPTLWFMPFLMVPLFAYLGHTLISSRISNLMKLQLKEINHPVLLAKYIQMVREEAGVAFKLKGRMQIHQKSCIHLDCFCRGQYSQQKEKEYFIRYLYQRALEQMQCRSLQENKVLIYDYITTLINTGYLPDALHHVSKLPTFTYFLYTLRQRLFCQLKHKLNQIDKYNIFTNEYDYALTYDKKCLQLTVEISYILKEKLQFWAQVAVQAPRMDILQKVGCSVVQRMYKLNIFYAQVVNPDEQKIFSFNATILYAMYLLSTTNFREYAQTIIKNTSRLLQSIKINENNIAQTFGLRSILVEQGRHYNDKHMEQKIDDLRVEELLGIKKAAQKHKQASKLNIMDDQQLEEMEEEEEDPHQGSAFKIKQMRNDTQISIEMPKYELLIDNVSTGLCKLLRIDRTQLISRPLEVIIPYCYKKVHHLSVQHLLNFQLNQLKLTQGYAFINRNMKVPISAGKGVIVVGNLCVKLRAGERGIEFVSVIQCVREDVQLGLINFQDERVVQAQAGFDQRIIVHKQIRRYLSDIKEQWSTTSKIKEDKVSLMMNSNNYSVTFSSPFAHLFRKYPVDEPPPIHVDMFNQSTQKGQNLKNQKNEELAKCMQKLQSVFYQADRQSQASSSKSVLSVVNVLSAFGQINSIPLYKYMQAVFSAVVILGLVACSIGYIMSQLSWDNTITQLNPTTDMLNLLQLRSNSIRMLNYLSDLEQYERNPQLNAQQIGQFFGVTDYVNSTLSQIGQMYQPFKNALYNLIDMHSNLLTGYLDHIWSQIITIYDPLAANPQYQTQDITMNDLMSNYLVDINLISLQKPSNKIIIAKTYTSAVDDLLNGQHNTAIISDSITKAKVLNLSIQLSMAVCVLLLVVPLNVLLKKRVKKHEDVYDLIVSVESALVGEEMDKVEYILNIVKNAGESREMLKANTLNYQINKISFKQPNSKSHHTTINNEMIQGLQTYKDDTQGDHLNPNANTKFQRRSQRKQTMSAIINTSLRKVKQAFTSELTSSLEGFKNSKQKTKEMKEGRKRAGELNLQKSEADPSRWILWKHSIFYGLVITFASFLIVNSVMNNYTYDQINQQKQTIIQMTGDSIQSSWLLLQAKVYLRNSTQASVNGGPLAAKQYLYSYLSAYHPYQNDVDSFATTTYANCSGGTVIFQKRCQYQSSLRILQGEYSSLLKSSFQTKVELDEQYQPNSTYYSQISSNLSTNVYYLQSITDQTQLLTQNQVANELSDMMNFTTNANQNMLKVFIFSILWAVISILVGLCVIMHLKHQYYKEVTIVSFLNTDMISKSKRVESFLQMLSKSSY